MEERDKCSICNNSVTKDMVVCPHCGFILKNNNKRIFNSCNEADTVDKNIETLDKMDLELCHLEEELDAFLCKKSI